MALKVQILHLQTFKIVQVGSGIIESIPIMPIVYGPWHFKTHQNQNVES